MFPGPPCVLCCVLHLCVTFSGEDNARCVIKLFGRLFLIRSQALLPLPQTYDPVLRRSGTGDSAQWIPNFRVLRHFWEKAMHTAQFNFSDIYPRYVARHCFRFLPLSNLRSRATGLGTALNGFRSVICPLTSISAGRHLHTCHDFSSTILDEAPEGVVLDSAGRADLQAYL